MFSQMCKILNGKLDIIGDLVIIIRIIYFEADFIDKFGDRFTFEPKIQIHLNQKRPFYF